ncbi:MAG: cell division protein FtsL [Pseudomonadota bacterium]
MSRAQVGKWPVGNGLLIITLIALCAVSIALAYTRHESRQLFMELQRLSKERDRLQVEWRQLQLEQSTFAAHGMIEGKAGDELALQRPGADDVFLITDQGDYRFVGLEPVHEVLGQIPAVNHAEAPSQ